MQGEGKWPGGVFINEKIARNCGQLDSLIRCGGEDIGGIFYDTQMD